MALPKIKVGDKQPVPCTKCGGKWGYSYSDHMKIYYTSHHDANGYYEGGQYSEGCRILNRGKQPICGNCAAPLNFRLIRDNKDEVVTKPLQ